MVSNYYTSHRIDLGLLETLLLNKKDRKELFNSSRLKSTNNKVQNLARYKFAFDKLKQCIEEKKLHENLILKTLIKSYKKKLNKNRDSVPKKQEWPNFFYEGKIERLESLTILIDDLDFQTEDHKHTPLHILTDFGHEEAALWYIKNMKQDSCNALSDPSKNSPLHYACRNTLTRVVRTLLREKKIDPNQMSASSYTPLHCACAKERFRVEARTFEEKLPSARLALELFARGANPALEENKGRRPVAFFGDKWEELIRSAFKRFRDEDGSNLPNIHKDVFWNHLLRKLSADDLFNASLTCKAWRNFIITHLANDFILKAKQ